MVSKHTIKLGDAVYTSNVVRLIMNKYIGVGIGKEQVDICWLRDPQTGKTKTKKFKNKPKVFPYIHLWLINQAKANLAVASSY